MKLKQLEGLLGGLTQFSDPKVLSATISRFASRTRREMRRPNFYDFCRRRRWWVQVELEQYATGPHIASRMLYTVVPSPDSDALLLYASCLWM
jgi:hypothetical protein